VSLSCDKKMSTYNITEIHFGILSQEEVVRQSTVEVTTNKLSIRTKTGESGNLYDENMGTMMGVCKVCKKESSSCPGHFGHVNLQSDIVHPMFSKYIELLLNVFCIKCCRLLLTQDKIKIYSIKEKHLLDKIKKIKYCGHCKNNQPKVKFQTKENVFYVHYKQSLSKQDVKTELPVREITRIFSGIVDEDLVLLGFDLSKFHPKSFVLNNLFVLPIRSRPYSFIDDGVCDDELTIQYCEIVKNTNVLKDPLQTLEKKAIGYKRLNSNIHSLFDNTGGKLKHIQTRSFKGLKERLTGKLGLMRKHMIAKRVNNSARSVIGPDTTLRLDEFGIPREVAKGLFFLEHVTHYNIKKLQRQMYKGEIQSLIRNKKKFSVSQALNNRNHAILILQFGDEVERSLQDNDYIIVNRQPSLHKGSWMAFRAKVMKGKTLRMNLGVTSSYNGDFDGDEMNVHPAYSQRSRAELIELANVRKNIIGEQSSKPTIRIVQDSLLGLHLLTKRRDEEIEKHTFMNILTQCDFFPSFEYIEKQYERLEFDFLPFHSGRTLFSILLPESFDFCSGGISISKGILIDGCINKQNISSIILNLQKEYPEDVVYSFINNCQFISNSYLSYYGFSIGISDCIIPSTIRSKIDSNTIKRFHQLKEKTNHIDTDAVKEFTIMTELNTVRDEGMKLAKDSFQNDNNMICCVDSGSKGDLFNVTQISSMMGQQCVLGRRPHMTISGGKRSLPHYFKNIDNPIELYESRGFIRNSLFKGLNPIEYWYHSMTGREGITDTVNKTSSSGYLYRRIEKLLEDVKVVADNTVRNSTGHIVQFLYGGNNLAPLEMSVTAGKPTFANLERLVSKLNNEYELDIDRI
jgi:DNA-directed RNA polymerase beta' subunit